MKHLIILKFNLKNGFIFFFLVLTFTSILLPNGINTAKADYVAIDWGDVVKLKAIINYQKPADPEPTFLYNGHITLYLGETVPNELNETYRKVKPMYAAFREKVIGMREGEERNFVINYKETGITDEEDIVYGSDLYYDVEFIEMLYDFKREPIFELTLDHPVLWIAMLGFLIIVLLIIENKSHQGISRRIRKRFSPLLLSNCKNCGTKTDLKCGFCSKALCRVCFEEKTGCPFCNRNKLVKK